MAEAKAKGHYITHVNKYDVLCGRGSGPNERLGNLNFRELVCARKTEYLAINPRDHKNKNRIAREIVEAVRSRGGRFLKRVAGVEVTDDEPVVYELAEEPTVLEKAKQALRQNRTGRSASYNPSNVYAGSQSNALEGGNLRPTSLVKLGRQPYIGERVSHLPPQPDSNRVSVSNIQQGNYGTSPAEIAIRNLQMKNYTARQEQQRKVPMQVNSTPGRNPYFTPAGGGFDDTVPMPPRPADVAHHLKNPLAMQQYEYKEQQSMPRNSMSGQTNRLTVPTFAGSDSDYLKLHLEQQMEQSRQNVSGCGGYAASLPQRREPLEEPFASLNSQAKGTISVSHMKALENIFAGTSQYRPPSNVRSGDSMTHLRTAYSGDYTKRSTESFIEGLEDMTLPSMSIGEISDFSANGGLSRLPSMSIGEISDFSTIGGLSRSRRSAGGTVVSAGRESIAEDSASDAFDHTMRPLEIALEQLPPASQQQMIAGDREFYPDRQVFFPHQVTTSPHANQNQLLEQEILAQEMLVEELRTQRDHAAKRVPNDQPMCTEFPTSTSSASKKKQRMSLSSYYRELRSSSSLDPK